MDSPDINDPTFWLNDPTQHIKVACRLCGDVWKFPIAYKEGFDKDPSWECPHCRAKRRFWIDESTYICKR